MLKQKALKFLRNKNQEGVTLLLAVLMLAAIMAISFSLTTILFIELKSSSDLLRTEGALYGATGVGEQALFNLKRDACPSGGSSCYVSSFSNNVSLLGTPQQINNNSPIFNGKVPVGSNFYYTTNKYDFCGTTPTYSTSTGAVLGCDFGRVTVNYIVTNNSTDELRAYLCEWDPNFSYTGPLPCTALGPQTEWDWVAPCSVGCGGSGIQQGDGSAALIPAVGYNTATWNLDPVKQQQLVLTNATGANDIYFSVVTYDADGLTPKGLPFVGTSSINISTQNGTVGRKVRVTVPNHSSSSSALPTAASFVTTDAATQGNWHGVYGVDGYNIIGATQAYPAYATVNPSGNSLFTYADPTADVRGPYKDNVTTNRIGAVWYKFTPWSLDVDVGTSATRQIALYFVDWDSVTRNTTISVTDSVTSTVLDTQTVSGYNGGKYLVWNISGHVKFTFTTNAGANSSLNGIFFK